MHTLGVILSWALCGLVVGFIARLVVPGPHRLGLIRTILLGIGGAFAGGLIYWAIYGDPGEPFSLSQNSWHGWIFSIIGAVLILALYSLWERRLPWWRRWW